MTINICRSVERAVSEPFLNGFHTYAAHNQYACASMTQFVQTNYR